MKHLIRLAFALLLPLMAVTVVYAANAADDEDNATPAEAAQRLKAIVDLVKAKGVVAAGQRMMSEEDPLKCKYKDMTCLLITSVDATFVANTAIPKLVGQKFPLDLVDVDGNPIIAAQVGPANHGQVKWDAKYKFARPGTKKVVPRWSFCEKVTEGHVACVVVAQQ